MADFCTGGLWQHMVGVAIGYIDTQGVGMIRIVTILLALAGFLGALLPAQAANELAAPSCRAAYGDIWADGKNAVPKREIDGSSIKTASDFMRMTGTREAGLKIVKGGDFSGWDFSGIPLANVCFEDSKLAGANFSDVRARAIGFIESDLSGSDMRGAQMPAILFRNVNLTHVEAQGADFSGGHFDGGWFDGSVAGWNIDGANMSGFTFDCGITLSDGCPVYQGGDPLSANRADFTEAQLHSFSLFHVELQGAILDRTIIGPDQLPELRGADIRGDIIFKGGDTDVHITPDEMTILLEKNADQEVITSNPSFDCSDAQSKVEEEICGEYGDGLRLADRDIAALYKQAKAVNPSVKSSQIRWLKQRNRCNAEEYAIQCIQDSYGERKGQLLGMLGESQWLAPGEEALFIDDVLPLPAEFAQSDLFARITPALIGASRTDILVRRQADGLYAIQGSAVGANAHLCSLSASHLYFDAQSGWYIPVSEGTATPIFRIFDGRLEVFANGRPDYDTYPDALDFISCGMRASFPETRRIEVSAEILEKYRQSFAEQM